MLIQQLWGRWPHTLFKYIIEHTWACIAIILLLIGASIPFQRTIDEERGKFLKIEHTVLLSPKSLKIMSLGFEEFVSDIYWLRALQYFGNPKIDINDKDPELTYKYFDLITELDPRFVNAYRFGGTFLSEPKPIGLGDFEKGENYTTREE